MGKIIKSDLEQFTIQKTSFFLSMKGQFKIEFANDTFGPYDYKFAREDCYYIDGLNDRGTLMFPLKNKMFDNMEIFLENDDIIFCTGERGGLLGENQNFVDIINIKTERKHRIFTDEVNLIYNKQNSLVINAKIGGDFKTIKLDIETLNILEEKNEYLQAFFKCVYNQRENKWFLLDFQKTGDDWNEGYFQFKEIDGNGIIPQTFDRKNFKVNDTLDIWKLSCM